MNYSKFSFSVFLIIATSCKKDLTQTPDTSKTAYTFFSSQAQMEQAVNATYATLQFKGNFHRGLTAIGEIPGEDVYDATPANDGGVYGQLDNFNTISQNKLIADTWKNAYQGIQGANIVLNRIQNINYYKGAGTDIDDSTKNSRIGEVKFIRALYYFYLVRIFGDVPLVTEEVKDPMSYFGQKRTNVKEIYDQIIKDLGEAIDVLPDRTESNKIRVFKTAAQTLLGKVYLTLQDYNNALNLLKKVESSGLHSLLPTANIEDIFSIDNELNEEIIFSVQFASGINSNSEGSDAYRMFNPTGRKENNMSGAKGHGTIKESFFDSYAPNDARKGVYIKKLPSGEAYSNKIAVPTTKISDSGSDWVVLRYADVILMLAEIENELGNVSEAKRYLNMIRNRAGIGDYPGVSDKASVFMEIDIQRRKELIWEGHRWFDLLRQKRAQIVLGISDPNKLLLPIPANQIATDGAIIQNPGYN